MPYLEQVLPLQKANSSHRHASRHNTKEMTKEYFNTLSQKQKEDLYHMFRLDFEMFNYDPNIYSWNKLSPKRISETILSGLYLLMRYASNVIEYLSCI